MRIVYRHREVFEHHVLVGKAPRQLSPGRGSTAAELPEFSP